MLCVLSQAIVINFINGVINSLTFAHVAKVHSKDIL